MYPRTLTLSSVGQITLPKSVRELLGLKKGAKLNLEVDAKTHRLTLKKQMTVDEVFDELERINKKYPHKPVDPKWSKMSVGEISLELAKDLEGDTWV